MFLLSSWVSSGAGETTRQAEGRKEVSPLQAAGPVARGSLGRISQHMKVWPNSWRDAQSQVGGFVSAAGRPSKNGDVPQGWGCGGEERRTTPMTRTGQWPGRPLSALPASHQQMERLRYIQDSSRGGLLSEPCRGQGGVVPSSWGKSSVIH